MVIFSYTTLTGQVCGAEAAGPSAIRPGRRPEQESFGCPLADLDGENVHRVAAPVRRRASGTLRRVAEDDALTQKLGGDGTVLYASNIFQNVVPPVVAFALGSLGFMTLFDFAFFRDTLPRVFLEGVGISLRLRLEATVMRTRRPRPESAALLSDDRVSQTQSSTPGAADLVEELISEETDERTHTPEHVQHVLNEVVIDRGPNPSAWPRTLA